MSLTGRPSSPPLALTSSSQIFIASSDILPLAASGPVSAMPKPMVMGSAARSGAAPSTDAASAATSETTARAALRRVNVSDMFFLPGIRARAEHHLFASIAQRGKGTQSVARIEWSEIRGSCPLTRIWYLCASERHRRPHEVSLAELDAAVAQDVVSGGAVEEEVGQRIGKKQRLAGELPRRAARERDLDRLVLGAVDLTRLEPLEEIDRLGDAVLELGNARLAVAQARHLGAGEPAAGVDRVIGRRAHLPRQRKHVGRKAHVEQHRRLDLP